MGIKRNIGEVSREKRRKRKVKPLVLIVSEGKDTEINYFKQFNQKYVNVDVKPVDKNSAGKNKSRKTDPSNLVDKAIEYIDNKYDINEEDGDRVWCLMDVDLNYNNPDPIESRTQEIQRAYTKVENYKKRSKVKINLGLSNPCFEIWYLLHYKYTTANFKNYDAVKERIEKDTPLKEYEKNKSIYSIIHDQTSSALINCGKLRNYHEDLGRNILDINLNNIKDVIQSNPYTNVDLLVGYIETLNEKL
ncbi:hypothetical protein CDLVIII_2110 [Clostridium sp. DL-VIII]|uniref:RloB family protein n=3 Tax=unclassified Clostridium TaxID=2614128 RepID=UPI00023AFA5E|nr:RloB family protein [Clostridium sp. DL-VIII]EHI98778.1 hypothetical protein CDLVIII_2110 [Clostridium sp. DL-VIII]